MGNPYLVFPKGRRRDDLKNTWGFSHVSEQVLLVCLKLIIDDEEVFLWQVLRKFMTISQANQTRFVTVLE